MVALAGLGFMVLVLLLTTKLGTYSRKASRRMASCADVTISSVRELVEGAKVAKLQVWEASYCERIRKQREAELQQLRILRGLQVVIMSLGRSSPIFANGITFVCVWLVRGHLDASVVFPAMQVFQALRVPFIVLPMGLPVLMQILVAAKRLSAHLALDDQPPLQALPPPPPPGAAPAARVLSLDGARLGWPTAPPTAPPSADGGFKDGGRPNGARAASDYHTLERLGQDGDDVGRGVGRVGGQVGVVELGRRGRCEQGELERAGHGRCCHRRC